MYTCASSFLWTIVIFGVHFLTHLNKRILSWESRGRRPRFLIFLFHDLVEFVQLLKQKWQVLPQQQKATIVYSCADRHFMSFLQWNPGFHIYFSLLEGLSLGWQTLWCTWMIMHLMFLCLLCTCSHACTFPMQGAKHINPPNWSW